MNVNIHYVYMGFGLCMNVNEHACEHIIKRTITGKSVLVTHA